MSPGNSLLAIDNDNGRAHDAHMTTPTTGNAERDAFLRALAENYANETMDADTLYSRMVADELAPRRGGYEGPGGYGL